MTIRRNGTYSMSSIQELHNNHYYSGADSYITISRMYSADFECQYAMGYYPFDIQECNMNFLLEVKQ